MPRKKKKGKQQAICGDLLPLLSKPFAQVGKLIEIPGVYWQLSRGRMSEEEKTTLFKCVVRDFSYSHKMQGESTLVQAFELQEMGITGTGSLEEGDSSGDIWWMKYPYPFLEYYYKTFPDENPANEIPAPTPTPATATATAEPAEVPETVSQFPNLKIPEPRVADGTLSA